MADVEDISQLENVESDSIRKTIKERYAKDRIYTNCGDILIAVNPYKDLPIFGEKQHEEYNWRTLQRTPSPHVFHVAARAYGRMQETHTNQVILVGGESGSGKTENTKFIVKHLVSMCRRQPDNLQERIVKINPLLEAFGNAKTTMNDNSSRFAKYLEVIFSADGQVKGAIVRDYLLEKSRVVDQLGNEGNFHIFYCLLAGASPSMLKRLRLKDASTYRILKRNKDLISRREFHSNMYLEQMAVLKSIDMDLQDMDIIHTVLAAILHITQVDFVEPDDPNEPLQIRDATLLENVADLLSVPYEDLGHALIATKQTYVGEVIVKRNSMSQAIDRRDALAKALYERLFGWVVRQININLHPSNLSVSTGICTNIGILDIAGFENLKSNSLEQICVNLINERLQNFTSKKIVDSEMSIYKEEGIKIPDIDFRNNDEVLNMFMKKTFGVLPLLEEESKLGHGSNKRFIKNLKDNYDTHECFTPSSRGLAEFGIKHFAGKVWYSGSMLIEKNRDLLSPDVTTCMKHSSNPFVSDLFTIRKGPTGTISASGHNIRKSTKQNSTRLAEPAMRQGKTHLVDLGRSLKQSCRQIERSTTLVFSPKDQKTVVSYFQTSMDELLSKMRQAEQYYIRCIKPNMFLQPNNFDDEKVSEQILYNGIAEVAKIRKLGLPVRKRYDEFTKRYRPLFPECLTSRSQIERTDLLLKKILPAQMMPGVRFGKNRLFMKEDVSIWLEQCRSAKERRAANTIARHWRGFIREQRRKQDETVSHLATNLRLSDNNDPVSRMRHSTGNDLGHSFTPGLFLGDSFGDAFGQSFIPGFGTGKQGGFDRGSAFANSYNRRDSWSNASSDDDTTYSPIDAAKIQSSVKPQNDHCKQKKQRAPVPPDVRNVPNRKDNPEQERTEETTTTPDKEFWDIFNIISRESKRGDIHMGKGMMVVKLVTYAVLGLLLLFCSVLQKISLATLVSNTSDFHYPLLLVVMCIPYVLVFLSSLWRSLFGNVHFPSKKNLIIVLIIEGLHSLGLSLLAFRVLPEIDVVRGTLLLSCTCIVPSILKPMCSSTRNTKNRCTSTAAKICMFILDLCAALIQISAIPVVVLTEYYINNKSFDGNEGKVAELIFALFLCSFSYWENFVDDRLCGGLKETNKFHILILGLKFDLQECRPVLYTVAAAVKILITSLLAFYLDEEKKDFNFRVLSNFFDLLGTEPKLLLAIPAVVSLALSSFIGRFVAHTACKLQMQIVSYSIPLLLSTPIAVCILYNDCQTHFLLDISLEDRTCDADLLDTWWHLPVAAAWLLSIYWVARYIWFPSQPRLAKFDDLFVNPLYCGILMEQDLIMNRRRHTRKIIKVNKEGHIYYRMMLENVRISKSEDQSIPPMVYACGTMWHETRQEMVQFLKSLLRMDKDQFLRKKAVNTFGVDPADVHYYEYEPHIFFDDAFETNADNERVPNSFVNLFVELMEEAASSVHEKVMTLKPPMKITTPYGGQLVYLMPGENLMFVHLKDQNKIRHRKRWSQVMYMYYLLGYRILKECQEVVLAAIRDDTFNDLVSWRQFERQRTGKVEKSQIFNFLDDEVLYRAQNTFILALDGDVEFTSEAVHLLIDKMRKNDRVGAVCGRIHPVGKGPVVWFQTFEYAVGYWLQKATEHVLGCVLCSPGCFSVFRGSALMDDNVMRKFTSLPTDASHYIMYDQGEDRWLSTLLLQQGYRVEYTAASDAFTYAPESFDELFNQRRRWMPSTIGNVMDLLQDGKNTVAVNNNISWLYIFYQYILMLSAVLGPGMVVMMIAGAIGSVFSTDIITSYLIASVPAMFYAILCFTVKPKNQILAAQFLGAWYIFVMAVVFVGCVSIAVQENALHPSVIFIESLVVIFILTACIHPHEFSCVLHGAMYFLCIPLGFLLIVIYSFCNMHVISWGTRELPKKKTHQEIAAEEKLKKEKEERKKQGFLARFMPKMTFHDIGQVLNNMKLTNKKKESTIEMLRTINAKFELLLKIKQKKEKCPDTNMMDTECIPEVIVQDVQHPIIRKNLRFDDEAITLHEKDKARRMEDCAVPKNTEINETIWVKQNNLGNGRILRMNSAEEEFWKSLIHRYLYPLEVSTASKGQVNARLIELRNNVCAAMAIINALWIAANFMFQLRKPVVINFAVPSDADEAEVNTDNFQVDVLGLMFVMLFCLMVLIQFIGMIVHRWGTFIHLIAITNVPNPFTKSVSETDDEMESSKHVAEKVLEFCERLDAETIPDYAMNSDEEKEEEEQVNRAMEEVINNIQEKGTKNIPGSMNPLGKSIRQSEFGTTSRGRTDRKSDMVKSIIRRTTRTETNILDLTEKQETDKSTAAKQNVLNDIKLNVPKLRFGAGVPLQKHFMMEVRNRKLPNTPGDFMKMERLSNTLTRGGYDHDTFIDREEDTDPIYDTIPALCAMDKAFSKKFKTFRNQEKQEKWKRGSRQTNTLREYSDHDLY
ncbi:uncharacterized protein LOC117321593 [Pecten maximus]|uniref:uncharacterized protein LOC117321593 n=1 Tax=Pecten maximus TaxID=6579 RepID=UPI001458CEE8|nr:uncharacterized protein LOC117321593 [Pecten maximus]